MSCSEDGGNCSLESSMEDLEVSSQASSGIVVTSTPVPTSGLPDHSDIPTNGKLRGNSGSASECGSSMSESTEIKADMVGMGVGQPQRISPLRGNSTQEDIVHQVIPIPQRNKTLSDIRAA